MQQSITAPEILLRLQEALTDAGAGQARAVLLEGAAGFGKSHTLRTFASVPKGLVLTAASNNWLTSVLSLCKNQLEIERDSAFLEAARRIAPNAGYVQVASAPDFADQNALWKALAFALERLAKRVGGLTLLLEDAHSASQDDLGALRAFYRRAMLGHTQVLIVLSSRPSETDLLEGFAQDAAIANELEPKRLSISKLEPTGLDALTRQHLHSDYLPDNLSAWLYARAEGHPLHTLELLRFLQDGGALQDLGISWVFEPPKDKAIPKNLNAILTARVANAKRDSRVWKALAALSVIEGECSLTDWAKLSGQTEHQLLELANRLECMGLVSENLRAGQTIYAVAHPLYPPLVRAQIETVELENLHRNALNITASLGERARHAIACRHEQALEFSRLALEEALTRFSHSEVVEHAQNILHDNTEDQNKIKQQLIDALKDLGQNERILELIEDDDSSQANLNRILALEYLGRTEGLQELVEQAFAKASEPFRSKLGFVLSRILMAKHQFEATEQVLESLQPLDDLDKAQLFYERCRLLNFKNEPLKALQVVEQAEQIARQHSEKCFLLLVLIQKNNILTCTEHHAESKQIEAEILELAQESGSAQRLTNVYQTIAFSFISRGQYSKAREPFARALRLVYTIKQPMMLANAYVNASIPEYAAANLEKARGLIERGIAIYREIGQHGTANSMWLYQTYAESLFGNLHAVQEFMASTAVKEPEKLYGWHDHAAGIYLNIGEFEKAKAILNQAPIHTYASDSMVGYEYMRALLSLQEDNTKLALDHIGQALEHSLAVGNESEHALMRFTRAIINLRLDNTQLAQTESSEALEVMKLNQLVSSLMPLERLFPEECRILRQPQSEPSESAQLGSSYLHTLGSFSLERDGKTTPWKASKTRELLAVLLIAYLREGGPKMSKTQIIDTLWQDEAGDTNTESKFRMTVKRLRESLGSDASIYNNQGMYELQNLRADVVFFLESLERLDFDAALGWYKGEFLPNIDLSEVEIIRAQLWQRFRDTALQISFESPNTNLLEKLHHLEPLDVGILERYLQLISGDAFRVNQVVSRARSLFEHETGEIPAELAS